MKRGGGNDHEHAARFILVALFANLTTETGTPQEHRLLSALLEFEGYVK